MARSKNKTRKSAARRRKKALKRQKSRERKKAAGARIRQRIDEELLVKLADTASIWTPRTSDGGHPDNAPHGGWAKPWPPNSHRRPTSCPPSRPSCGGDGSRTSPATKASVTRSRRATPCSTPAESRHAAVDGGLA